MARKTNKTAHVLSLLANGTAGENDVEGEDSSSLAPNISIVDTATSSADPLAGLIRNTLSKEFEGDSEPSVSDDDAAGETAERAASEADTNDTLQDETEPAKTKSRAKTKAAAKPKTTAKSKKAAETESEDSEDASATAESGVSSDPESTTDSEVSAESEVNSDSEDASGAKKTKAKSAKTGKITKTTKSKKTAKAEEEEAVSEESPQPETLTASPEEKSSEDIPVENNTDKSDSSEDSLPNSEQPKHDKPQEIKSEEENSEEPASEYVYLNMMNILVDERLMEFLNRFGACTCDRCKMDAKALALSNLPPKYLVIPASSKAPLTSFYRNKYSIFIVTELTKSCLAIINSPRH